MGLDPKERGGKGRFPDQSGDQPLDDKFVEKTVKKAGMNRSFLDFVFMIMVGFGSVLKGFLFIDNKEK